LFFLDVAFAGCATLNGFIKMKEALEKENWKKAGEELKDSCWCEQVKSTRCTSNYNCIVDGKCTTLEVFTFL
jgi:hypothetical protein